MNSIRVLCIIETLGLGGGAEQLLVSLLPRLQELGLSIEVVALFDWVPDIGYLLECHGIKVHRWRLGARWNLLPGVLRTLRLLASGQFDVVWGHLYFGNLYATLGQLLSRGRVNAVISLHSPGYPSGSRRPSVLLESLIMARAGYKVAVSQAVRAAHLELYHQRPISVVYNGGDVQDSPGPCQSSARVREKYGISESDFLLVVPSRFTSNKGQSELLDSLSLLASRHAFRPKLVNPGTGPTERFLRAKAESLGLAQQVTLLPSISHLEMLELMKVADLVVMPSLREPFGIAAVEAMLLGCCVLVSRVDGLEEIAGPQPDEWLCTVPPGDTELLAARILELASSSEERAAWSKKGRARASSQFSMEACAKNWFTELSRAHPRSSYTDRL